MADETNTPIRYAFELTILLRKSGTGEGKLEILRDLITRNPTASAQEGLKALQDSGRVHETTLTKAAHIVRHGVAPPKPEQRAPVFIEDELHLLADQAEKQKARAAGKLEENKTGGQVGPTPLPGTAGEDLEPAKAKAKAKAGPSEDDMRAAVARIRELETNLQAASDANKKAADERDAAAAEVARLNAAAADAERTQRQAAESAEKTRQEAERLQAEADREGGTKKKK